MQGKTVVIFGGTSGIGLAAAKQAQAQGARVIVIGSDEQRARQAAEEHRLSGWRAADVTRPESITAALVGIERVDHLVLLAGTFVAGKVQEAETDYLRRAFEERIWAAVHTLRTLGERLAPDASVTFISGQLADRPNAQGTAILAAASAAMEALARGLAVEQAPRRFNTLSPGPIETPMLTRLAGPHLEGMRQGTLLKRLGRPEDAAAAVLFLMNSEFMNGETLHVDGGGRLV